MPLYMIYIQCNVYSTHTQGGRDSQALVNTSEILGCIWIPSFLSTKRASLFSHSTRDLMVGGRITYRKAGQGSRLLIHIPEHVNHPRASLHQGITTGKVDEIQRGLVIPEAFFVDFQGSRGVGSSGGVEGVNFEIKHRKWW